MYWIGIVSHSIIVFAHVPIQSDMDFVPEYDFFDDLMDIWQAYIVVCGDLSN